MGKQASTWQHWAWQPWTPSCTSSLMACNITIIYPKLHMRCPIASEHYETRMQQNKHHTVQCSSLLTGKISNYSCTSNAWQLLIWHESAATTITCKAESKNSDLTNFLVRGNLTRTCLLILSSKVWWNCLVLSRLQWSLGTVAVLMMLSRGGRTLCREPISSYSCRDTPCFSTAACWKFNFLLYLFIYCFLYINPVSWAHLIIQLQGDTPCFNGKKRKEKKKQRLRA